MTLTQGQGLGTEKKQRRFASAMRIGMQIFANHRKLLPYPYWLFDSNCGSGLNEEVGVLGSPITAHKMAEDAGLSEDRRMFFFCDKDAAKIAELRERLSLRDMPRSFLHVGNNEEALEVFANTIRRSGDRAQFAMGLIVVDPNGWWYRNARGEGPPVEALQRISRQFPRLDILLNLNVQAYKRQRGAGILPLVGPLDIFRALNRAHWLIGQIVVGHHSFMVAVGRNLETGDHAKVQMYHLDSDEGRHILRWIENDGQPEFLLDLPKLRRVPEAPSLPFGEGDSSAPS